MDMDAAPRVVSRLKAEMSMRPIDRICVPLLAQHQPGDGRSERRVGARLSGDLFVLLAALGSSGYGPMDGQPSRIFIHRRYEGDRPLLPL